MYPTPAQVDVLVQIEALVNAIPIASRGVRERFDRDRALDEARPQVASLVALANTLAGASCPRTFLSIFPGNWMAGHASHYATNGVGTDCIYVCQRCGQVNIAQPQYDI